MVGRDEHGRYIKGHKSNGGRKPREVDASYLSVTLGAVSLDDWEEIVLKACQQAKRGDSTARKWLSDYILGIPTQRMDVKSDNAHHIVIEYADDSTNQD